MRPTFSLRITYFLVFIVLASAPSLAAPGHSAHKKSHAKTNSSSKHFGPLKAYKESSTYYHRSVPQVPYYTNRPPGLNGITRKYYFGIEEIDYDYAPLGYDHFNGAPLNQTVAAQWTVSSSTRIGSVYMKAVYREYTDGTYTNRISHPDYMGFLGPIIRAEVGDTIQITLRNMATYNYSFHVHGLYYNAASDGTDYAGAIGGKVVPPNMEYTYVFDIPARSGPGKNDPSSMIWAYSSNVSPNDIYSGLIGAMIIYKKGLLTPYGPNTTKIQAEVITLLNVADENLSNYFEANIARFISPNFTVDPSDSAAFYESNKMYHINGFVYSNLDSMQLQQGNLVRWYVMALGNQIDIHTAHWHGSTALEAGHRTDVVSLLPASFKIVDLIADNPGSWLFHCHVSQHMMAGMVIMYQINVPSSEHGWSKRSIEEKASFVPARKI